MSAPAEPSTGQSPAWLGGILASARRNPSQPVKWLIFAALIAFALSTPGFLSVTSIRSLLTTVSFIGCVAVGATFITLSGNIMSFSIGAAMSATTIVFMSCLPVGLMPAIAIAFAFCAVLNGAQGWVIGYFRANPIIVSMAGYALIVGGAIYFTGGRGIYPQTDATDILRSNLGPIPGPLVVFLAAVLIGEGILTFTWFGRNLYLVGTSARAAKAAGIEPWRTVVWAYMIAGLFTALSAVLIAARYRSGDMEHGIGYEYRAISAVLVGGTAIQGGHGSVLRTLVGTLFIAMMQGVLVLRGFSVEMQYLLIGILVLAAITLQWRARS